MNPKILILQVFEQIYSYNIFVHDEAEDDNNDGQVRDQANVIKHQRYATRLYLGFFIGVSGFWKACYQLDALFKSTLDCLYDADCLVLFSDYFPSLNNMNLTSSILSSSPKNVSVENRLSYLFVDEWSTKINYSKYVEDCAPLFCTYAITDQINFSYTITLLLSLYGGLVIMLRFIAASVVNIAAKTKFRLPNINADFAYFVERARKFGVWLKQLNLFSEVDFNGQLNAMFTQFYQSAVVDFYHLIDLVLLITQVDQPYAGIRYVSAFNTRNAIIIIRTMINETNGHVSLRGDFLLPGLQNITSYFLYGDSSVNPDIYCTCATDLNCRQPAQLYECHMTYDDVYFVPVYAVPENPYAHYVGMHQFQFQPIPIPILELELVGIGRIGIGIGWNWLGLELELVGIGWNWNWNWSELVKNWLELELVRIG
ncbi:unnamed protein product [Adineta steineri]|uniref:Uncharacterized protein n=1 Tax=Adineta steineri TaxID=433720 RepID=A0A816AY87_9BILA|nr:unnamed protein product [Adineta steineri]CAF1603030.1 unnamed protein product [Adineta steineri]